MSASREKSKRKEAAANPASTPNQKKGMSKGLKRTLGIVCAVLVIAVIVFFTMLSTGFLAEHTTAAVVSGHKISPVTVNYYYRDAYQSLANQMGDFFSYMVDANTPLDEQYYDEEAGTTWADFLTDQALLNAAGAYAIHDEAVANGFTLTEEDEANIDASIEMLDYYATAYGYESTNMFLVAQYGNYCNTKNYRDYLEFNTLVGNYAQHVNDSFTYTDDDLTAEYDTNPNEYDTIRYRLFSVTASLFEDEQTDTDTESTDEEKAAAEEALKQKEESLAREMAEASEGNESAFIAQALKNAAEDTKESYRDNSYTLRSTNSYSGTITEIADWLYDSARQEGDTTYIESSTGYYVLYFISRDTHDYGMPNVRHILVRVSDTTDEEAMAEAKAKAEDLLAQYEAGEKAEDAFAELAKENSDDGNAADGGLYENIYPGQMVSEFEDWCYDASRQVGDTGIIESDYGYHVMYFAGRGDNCRDYLVEAALREADYEAWSESVTGDASYQTVAFGMRLTTK